MRHKLAIGIIWYGPQWADWWLPLVEMTSLLHKVGIDSHGILGAGSMMADGNRNQTVAEFLDTAADWLLWIDADNMMTTGAVKRLIECNRTLVSGLYYARREPYNAIAYFRQPNGMYRNVDESEFTRGEVIPINAAGCGCLLTHRSVYEDIPKHFTLFQRENGTYRLVDNNDIVGKPPEEGKSNKSDGKVVNGQLRERLVPVHTEPRHFPYFTIEYGRTEDLYFFERAEIAGHKLWLDTSVEAGHLRTAVVTGETRRRKRYSLTEKKVVDVPRQPDGYNIEVLTAADMEIENEGA